jgi:hypothetical protein
MGPRFGFGQGWQVLAQHPILWKITVGGIVVLVLVLMLRRHTREREAQELFLADCVARAISEDECDDLLDRHHVECFGMSYAAGGRAQREFLDRERYVECVRISPAEWSRKRREILRKQGHEHGGAGL